jgi:copper chaperone CopZ
VLSISVNGLVCDFCARSIEKLFSKKESVKSINVNLEEMLITINLKKGKFLNDDIIRQVIRDSGYDIKEINREK